MKIFFYITLSICILFSNSLYAKDQVPEAMRLEKMSEAGQVLLDAKMYKDALKIFMNAYSRFKPPKLVLPGVIKNIGLCHEGMGNNKEAVKFFREFLKCSKSPDDKKLVTARIDRLEGTIKSAEIAKKAMSLPAKKSKVKAILFWTGVGVMGLGVLAQMWGYEQYRSANTDTMTAPQYYHLKHEVNWKYYTAYGLYAAGAIAVITSFFVGRGKHPLGIGVAPSGKGGTISVYTRW